MHQYSETKDFLDLSMPKITHDDEIRLSISLRQNFVPFKHRTDLSHQQRSRYRKGCADRERLIRSNVLLITKVAKRFESSGIEMRFLLDFGMIGLITATESYDPYKINPETKTPYKFSTHATWQILKEMSDSAEKHRTIRVPTWVKSTLSVLKKVKAALEIRLGRNPTHLEIVGEMPPTGKFNKPFTQERLDFLLRSKSINNIVSIEALTTNNEYDESTGFDIKDPFDAWNELELRDEFEAIAAAKPIKAKRKSTKNRRKKLKRIKDFSKKMRSGNQLGLKISIKPIARTKRTKLQKPPIGINENGIQQLTLDLETSSVLNLPQFDRHVRRYAEIAY